jgi:TetR/AcrR family transcriptional repressor of nem operon
MIETQTKLRILNAAYELMLAQGYAATGVNEICRRAEVSKGSFYHFFETKQQCALAMMWHHMEEAEQMLGGLDVTQFEPIEAALRYVQYIEDLAADVFKQGCLFGAFALELAETHPELRVEVAKVFSSLTDYYEKILEPVSRACVGPDSPSSRQLAEQLVTVIEGGVVLSKAHNDVRFLPQGLRLFRHYLQRLCESKTSVSQ